MAVSAWSTGADTGQKIALITQLLRLLIGLSTGSIVLVATFLRDVFSQHVARQPLLIAVSAFTSCVFFSMLFFIGLTRDVAMGNQTRAGKYLGSTLVFVVAEFSFVVGLICLAYFVMANLSMLGST